MSWPRLAIFLTTGCFYCLSAFSQITFKTIVPQHSLIAGESFQVQYIIENASNIENVTLPQFPGFKLVSGPNFYEGNKPKSYRNLVITLSPIREGKFKISGAACLVNGKLFKSNDVFLRVMAATESDESSYFLRPGEDPWKKIRKNLFLKLIVDKHTCFIGEPLVATFKLYSRLQSKSDVIKNPGCYGFSVYDVINVHDNIQTQEKIQSHWFDVHTIRKVQLYPLQVGIFTIDPMEVANKIEFSRSIVHKTTEQELTENMYNKKSTDNLDANAEVYEINLRTAPLQIKVRPLPGRNPTDTFAGAVGNFTVRAFVEKDSILRNEENSLFIDIAGAGNFQKISAPAVDWPQNIEVFEPTIADTLDKQQIPLTGQRRFKYVFVTDKPGDYIIPAVSFSFFDLKRRNYRTISTKPQSIFVSSKGKVEHVLRQGSITTPSNHKLVVWVSVVSLFLLLAGISIWAINKRKGSTIKADLNQTQILTNLQNISIDDLLKPAEFNLHSDDKIFFEKVNEGIWNYFNQRFQFSGSEVSKPQLAKALIFRGITHEKIEDVMRLIYQSEIGMYTDVNSDLDKKQLLENTRQILQQIETPLS